MSLPLFFFLYMSFDKLKNDYKYCCKGQALREKISKTLAEIGKQKTIRLIYEKTSKLYSKYGRKPRYY